MNNVKILKSKAVVSSAKGFNIRISPYKLRRVANVVRGKETIYAESLLKQLPHKGAKLLLKIVQSAVANARNNSDVIDPLYISELMVNEGSHFKRFQPKARGRIYKIIKRTSHVSLLLSSKSGGVR